MADDLQEAQSQHNPRSYVIHQHSKPVTRRTTYHISEAVVAPDCSITSGATGTDISKLAVPSLRIRTPIWTPNYGIIAHASCCGITGDTEVGKLHRSVLVGENVGAFNVPVYHSLVMQVDQAFQHLGYIHRNQIFRELSKSFGDVVQGTILAKSAVP